MSAKRSCTELPRMEAGVGELCPRIKRNLLPAGRMNEPVTKSCRQAKNRMVEPRPQTLIPAAPGTSALRRGPSRIPAPGCRNACSSKRCFPLNGHFLQARVGQRGVFSPAYVMPLSSF